MNRRMIIRSNFLPKGPSAVKSPIDGADL